MLVASSTWPGGLPEAVLKAGDAPAGVGQGVVPTPVGQGTQVTLRRSDPFAAWDDANVVRGVAKGTVSAVAYSRLGDITSEQFRALASIQRELAAEVRITNRQNLVFRNLSESQLPVLFERLSAIGMAEPGAELSRDVVACPGADTCNLAVTQSRGLADAIGAALDEAGDDPDGGLGGRLRREAQGLLTEVDLLLADVAAEQHLVAGGRPGRGPGARRRRSRCRSCGAGRSCSCSRRC